MLHYKKWDYEKWDDYKKWDYEKWDSYLVYEKGDYEKRYYGKRVYEKWDYKKQPDTDTDIIYARIGISVDYLVGGVCE